MATSIEIPPSSSPGSTAGRVISCRAAVAWAPGEKIAIEQIDVDPPQKDEVRVKILYTALCQSDVTFWKMEALSFLFPRIFGHEAAGIVESVGEGVTNVAPGDTVLPVVSGQCDECQACKINKSNVCPMRPADSALRGTIFGSDKHRFSCNGKPINNFLATSTFTEYTVVHKNNVVKINSEAPLSKVCLVSCGVGTGLGAAWNVAKVQPGTTVAIFGLGTTGLAVAEGCRVAGASRIIGVDVNPARFDQGKLVGVTDFINPKDITKPVQEEIMELTQGGVDYSFECVGNPKLMKTAFECLQLWGTEVVVGIPSDLSANIEANICSLLTGKKVTGTYFGGYRARDVPELVEKGMRKEYQLDLFVTHRLPLSQINEGLELMRTGEALRVVLHME